MRLTGESIQYKSLFGDWKEVTLEQAVSKAVILWTSKVGTANYKLDQVNKRFIGVEFQLIDF